MQPVPEKMKLEMVIGMRGGKQKFSSKQIRPGLDGRDALRWDGRLHVDSAYRS